MTFISRFAFDGDVRDTFKQEKIVWESPVWTEGVIGQAALFDGVETSFPTIKHTSNSQLISRFFNKRDNVSLTLRLRVDNFDGLNVVVGQPSGYHYSSESVGFWVTGSNRCSFVLGTHRDGNPSGGTNYFHITDIPTGVYVHYALVIDNGVMTAYVDGELYSTLETNTTLTHLNENVDIIIGGVRNTSDTPFTGAIEDVTFYDHPLSIKEIKNSHKRDVFGLKSGKSSQMNRYPNTNAEIRRAIPTGNYFVMSEMAELWTGYKRRHVISSDFKLELRCFFEVADLEWSNRIFGAKSYDKPGNPIIELIYGSDIRLLIRGDDSQSRSIVQTDPQRPKKADVSVVFNGNNVSLSINDDDVGNLTLPDGLVIDLSEVELLVGGINLGGDSVNHGKLEKLYDFHIKHELDPIGATDNVGYLGSITGVGSVLTNVVDEDDFSKGKVITGKKAPPLIPVGVLGSNGALDFKSSSHAFIVGQPTSVFRMQNFTFMARLSKKIVNNWNPLFSIGLYLNNYRAEGWNNKSFCVWFSGQAVQIGINMGTGSPGTRTPLTTIPIDTFFDLGITLENGHLKVYIDHVLVHDMTNRGFPIYPNLESMVVQLGGLNVYSWFQGIVNYVAMTPTIHNLSTVVDYKAALNGDSEALVYDSFDQGDRVVEGGIFNTPGQINETGDFLLPASLGGDGVLTSPYFTEVY